MHQDSDDQLEVDLKEYYGNTGRSGTSSRVNNHIITVTSSLYCSPRPMHYKTIVLNSRPLADIESDTFRTEMRPRSELKPGKGEALVQCTWLSLDPAMRGYIRDTRSYLPPVKIGEVCHVHIFGGLCAVGAG